MRGQLWPEERVEGEEVLGVARTQRRWLEISGLVLGLVTVPRLGERIADVLGLIGLDHQRARERWAGSRRRVERAGAVFALLPSLDPERWDRVLATGHLAGLWGRPWSIDPATGRRKGLPIRDPPHDFAVPPSPGAS